MRQQSKTNFTNIFSRKGQLNQVFMFIMALMVMGLIVLIATKSIGGLMGGKCDVDLINFKEQINEEIASNNDYGSVTELKLNVPCDYETLCLVDSSVINNDYDTGLLRSNIKEQNIKGEFIISLAVKDKIKNNVFLTNGDGSKTTQIGYIKEIQLKNPNEILCFEALAGSFKLKTKGLGRNTQIMAIN